MEEERNSTPGNRKANRLLTAATWLARIALIIVFIVNVQCAVGFIVNPAAFAGAYEQSGVAGNAAMQGMGVVFLMWNATYPMAIVNPDRYSTVFGIVLAQQIVGLIGENAILAGLPAGHEALANSIQAFINFDAFGLIIMGATFIALLVARRHARS